MKLCLNTEQVKIGQESRPTKMACNQEGKMGAVECLQGLNAACGCQETNSEYRVLKSEEPWIAKSNRWRPMTEESTLNRVKWETSELIPFRCQPALAYTEQWFEILIFTDSEEKRWNDLYRIVRDLASTGSSQRRIQETAETEEESKIVYNRGYFYIAFVTEGSNICRKIHPSRHGMQHVQLRSRKTSEDVAVKRNAEQHKVRSPCIPSRLVRNRQQKPRARILPSSKTLGTSEDPSSGTGLIIRFRKDMIFWQLPVPL